jgi:hypothetical protein
MGETYDKKKRLTNHLTDRRRPMPQITIVEHGSLILRHDYRQSRQALDIEQQTPHKATQQMEESKQMPGEFARPVDRRHLARMNRLLGPGSLPCDREQERGESALVQSHSLHSGLAVGASNWINQPLNPGDITRDFATAAVFRLTEIFTSAQFFQSFSLSCQPSGPEWAAFSLRALAATKASAMPLSSCSTASSHTPASI